jgi:hypothetical protein
MPPRVRGQPANQPLQQADSLRISDYLGCSVFRTIHLSSSRLLKRQSRANLDRLNIVLSEQLVDRSWMDPKVIGYFCRGHDH